MVSFPALQCNFSPWSLEEAGKRFSTSGIETSVATWGFNGAPVGDQHLRRMTNTALLAEHELYAGHDPRERPLYSFPEAGRATRMVRAVPGPVLNR